MATILFDTSALVRRYHVVEPGSDRVRRLCRQSEGQLATSEIVPVEIASAFARTLREGSLDAPQRARLWRLFTTHRRTLYRVVELEPRTLRLAERLIARHPLRAFDAVHIAAALRVARDTPTADFRFVTAGRLQATASLAEGLAVEFIA